MLNNHTVLIMDQCSSCGEFTDRLELCQLCVEPICEGCALSTDGGSDGYICTRCIQNENEYI
jgi:hypothetical protein